MNALILILPLLLIRYLVLAIANKDALARAAFYPPVINNEKIALFFYQISNIFLILYLITLTIDFNSDWFLFGLITYLIGIVIFLNATLNFAHTNSTGINTNGLYKFTRNPMYIGYFFFYLGCVLLTQSIVLLIILIIFQVSSHWIILSEERWCIHQFKDEYLNYMKKVRRYF